MIALFAERSPQGSDAGSCATRLAVLVGVAVVGALVVGIVLIPMTAMSPGILNAVGGLRCISEEDAQQAQASGYAEDSIPENYLRIYREVGEDKGIPWNVLAGIGQVESKHGRWDGPGITEGHNDWGAAGPMQFGALDGSAAGNSWGGEPIMDVEDRPEEGYGQDGNGDGVVNVYDPADAIPAAADYLIAHGAREDLRQAIFGYNHAWWYVDEVMTWAENYDAGEFETSTAIETAVNCELDAEGVPIGQAPDDLSQAVVDWALDQRGKPYLWGGTGPNAFDCSGLVMRAYESIGVSIPRVSQDQWSFGPRVPEGREQPGDLVFFDVQRPGEPPGPGHVGMVVGDGLMVEAWCTDCGPIAVREYHAAGRSPVLGFTRPLEHPDVAAQLQTQER
ncbi:cell wall-associated NlpC family hydrolase [Streptomonospora nanhaiensis]|uniref:Cell wall-associated NlpC family hydrolase n=1 Tax=Streptomonospora nanhaiensis TaxID=1323731 RepID=A0A853BSI3_9ACTN|nr:C40 family peptidase [Streptomonospora nanhaiensis]NYI97834.1 cell wall-associated NlpC family hydrolase [Streptomonospora nanhaiensis]